MFTRRAMLAAAAGVVASQVTDSWAQPVFPTRPVTIVAPFTPGTPADVAARRVAQAMTGTLSQSVVVENRSGRISAAPNVVVVPATLRAVR